MVDVCDMRALVRSGMIVNQVLLFRVDVMDNRTARAR